MQIEVTVGRAAPFLSEMDGFIADNEFDEMELLALSALTEGRCQVVGLGGGSAPRVLIRKPCAAHVRGERAFLRGGL